MGFKVTTPRFLGEEITQTNDDFDLVNLAFDHFVPSVFVEHYDSFRSFAVGSVPMPALRGVIGSTRSWYYRERFKFIAAEVCESGGRSIGVQHGAIMAAKKSSDLEEEVLDRDEYITCSWTTVSALNDQRAKIMALPSLKLCGTRPRTKAHNSGHKILFAGSEMPRFPRWIGKDDFEIFRKD